MFDLKAFIVKNIVNGIKNGTFEKEYGNIMAVNYLVKGILTEENIVDIDTQVTEWEASQVVEETPVEELVEDIGNTDIEEKIEELTDPVEQ